MQELPLTDPYHALLQQGDTRRYLEQLAQDGPGWWFNMDIPRIALHLQPVQGALRQAGADLPPRLAFLASVTGEIPEPEMVALYQRFIDAGDLEGAAAAAGAGCGAVWDSGFDFRRFQPWLERIDSLLDSGEAALSPLARASILGFRANAEMNGRGDLKAATASCRQQILAAEQARSSSLRIFHAAQQTYCHLWHGDLAAAGVLLQDAAVLSRQADASPVALVFLLSSNGLFHTLNGDSERGRTLLEQACAHPQFMQMPPSVWLLVQANLLFSLAHCEDLDALEAVAERIRARVISQQNAFHHSFSHFSLGVAALNLGQPHKALAHAEQAIERGLAAHSAVAERMPVLLQGQALADLGRDREALDLFEDWMAPWQDADYGSVAATAAQEAAWICLRQGQPDKARDWYQRAGASVPAGQRPTLFHRPPGFARQLQDQLLHIDPDASPRAPVQVHCLGELRIQVGERTVYDRKWRGGRTKTLLKALIVQGGRKISMEQLADTLWPDSEGDRAYRNLKVLVWRLRHLGLDKGEEPSPWLQLKHGQLSLVEDYCSVDAIRFETGLRAALHHARLNPQHIDRERLQHCLDRYTGDFLTGDASTTWIIEHRERLRQLYLEGVLVLAAAARDPAARRHSLGYLQRARDIDPLDERIYEHLMRHHLALGYPAKALEAYHNIQETLERELAITPGATLVALARQAAGDD